MESTPVTLSVAKGACDLDKLAVLNRYAQKDAARIGLVSAQMDSLQGLADFMAKAGDTIFLPGDPNGDNYKRNLCIQVYIDFDVGDIVRFCSQWLKKWKILGYESWHKELSIITQNGDPVELADILLSTDENRIRQRLSFPFAQMLEYSDVLAIKRKYQF